MGEHHQVHAGEESGEERQNPRRMRLVPTVAEAVEARQRAAEIDHDQKERGERVDAEMRAQAGQPERQDHGRQCIGVEGEMREGIRHGDARDGERCAVDERAGEPGAHDRDRQHRDADQGGNASKRDDDGHRSLPFARGGAPAGPLLRRGAEGRARHAGALRPFSRLWGRNPNCATNRYPSPLTHRPFSARTGGPARALARTRAPTICGCASRGIRGPPYGLPPNCGNMARNPPFPWQVAGFQTGIPGEAVWPVNHKTFRPI